MKISIISEREETLEIFDEQNEKISAEQYLAAIPENVLKNYFKTQYIMHEKTEIFQIPFTYKARIHLTKTGREQQTNLTCTYRYKNLIETLANTIQQYVENSRNAKMIPYVVTY